MRKTELSLSDSSILVSVSDVFFFLVDLVALGLFEPVEFVEVEVLAGAEETDFGSASFVVDGDVDIGAVAV